MNKFKLIPQLRENCVIEGPPELINKYDINDVVFLLSDDPVKRFSIISRIEGKDQNAGEPKIIIDKRILGKFSENDKVEVLKYNPAEAKEIQIGISNDFGGISSGDWTSTIKPSVLNKLVDLGQEISFLIPWEGGSPIVGTGTVINTLPNPPVYLGERTTIFLKKKPKEKLSKIKKEKIKEQTERVSILEKQMEYNTLDIITRIKHGNYPNKGQKYKFTAVNPRKLFDSVQEMFKGLKVIESPYEQTYDSEKQDYFASVVYFLEKKGSPQLIDIQIISSENSGSLLMWITGKDETNIKKTLDLYNNRIVQLKQGLEQKVEVMSINCPECGAQLPINDMELDGMVKCKYCETISRIPKAMRY